MQSKTQSSPLDPTAYANSIAPSSRVPLTEYERIYNRAVSSTDELNKLYKEYANDALYRIHQEQAKQQMQIMPNWAVSASNSTTPLHWVYPNGAGTAPAYTNIPTPITTPITTPSSGIFGALTPEETFIENFIRSRFKHLDNLVVRVIDLHEPAAYVVLRPKKGDIPTIHKLSEVLSEGFYVTMMMIKDK